MKTGKPLIAYVKTLIDTLLGYHEVPSADSVANTLIRDVLGNKNDTHSGASLMGLQRLAEEHMHHIPLVYPLLANPITLTKAAGAWAALPTPTEIIPASTITNDFDIHAMNVSSISAAGEYIIALYKGAALSEELIGYKPVSRSAVNAQEGQVRMATPLISANERISAAISSSNAGADTLDVKIEYHTY